MFLNMGALRARRQPGTGRPGHASPARLARAAASGVGLALPRLAEDVAVRVRSAPAARANARLARFLLEAGVVRERDVPARWSDPFSICEVALQRWLELHLGALRCLSPSFSMELRCDGSSCRPQQAVLTDGVRILWGERSVLRWEVGAGLEWLEEREPGLGAAVLATVDAHSDGLYPIFTPRVAMEVASFLYWYGEDDESAALDDMCDTPDEREALRDEMVTAQSMREAFPGWALGPAPTDDGTEVLRRAAADPFSPEAMRRIATLALELSAIPADREFTPDADGMFIGFGAVLCWRPDDVAMRISDDLAQYAWQDEYVDHIGEFDIALDDPAAMRSWMRRLRVRLRGIALLDDLIWMLSEGYCLNGKGA